MIIRVSVLGLAIAAFMALSCDEPADPTMVWGELQCDQCGDTWRVDGELATDGKYNYYGFCRRDKNKFSFIVADGAPPLGGGEHFFEIRNIKGAPTMGVYESGKSPKDGDDFEKNFEGARIIYTNDWQVEENQISDTCSIALYAEALVPEEGDPELTPKKYDPAGIGMEFEYYVRIDVCNGLEVPDTGNVQNLTGMQLELWFQNCDG